MIRPDQTPVQGSLGPISEKPGSGVPPKSTAEGRCLCRTVAMFGRDCVLVTTTKGPVLHTSMVCTVVDKPGARW
jgi:hypothetical protein